MSVREQRQVASDTGLSKQRVVVEAVRLADREGVDGLSMRFISAGALGAGAMSLYHYVASKEELLDAMIDIVFEEIEPRPRRPTGTGDATAVGIRPTGSRTPPVGERPDGVADIAGAREPPPPRSGHRLPAEGWFPGLDGDARQLRQLRLRFALQEASLPFDTADELADMLGDTSTRPSLLLTSSPILNESAAALVAAGLRPRQRSSSSASTSS